jgi:hypothetical protein
MVVPNGSVIFGLIPVWLYNRMLYCGWHYTPVDFSLG